MDFGSLERRQESFVRELRCQIRDALPEDVAAQENVRRDEHNPEFFRTAGRHGWIVPQWPVDEGGAGFDLAQARILETELLRVDAPVANLVTSQMVLPTVARKGNDELRAEVMGRVTSGETGISLGYTESESGSDIATVKTRADRDGDSWVVNGEKLYTTGAHHCGYCFLLTRTRSAGPRHRGLTMFLVPMTLSGITVSPIHTLGERTNTVTLEEVLVPDRYRIGAEGDGWNVLMGPLSLEHGLGSSTGPGLGDIGFRHARRLAQAVDAAMDWAQADPQRVANPTVRRRVARAAVAAEASTAVWGERGRIQAVGALVDGTADLFSMVGHDVLLDGFDSPVGFLERWIKQAQVAPIYGGTVEVFRNIVAQDLGLARPHDPAAKD